MAKLTRARLEAQLANVQSARRAQLRYIDKLVDEKGKLRDELKRVEADLLAVLARINHYKRCERLLT